MFIFWDKLNGKLQTGYLHRQYFFELLEFCTGIFEWTLPKGLDPKYLERMLHSWGMAAVTRKDNGEYRLSLGGLDGNLDQYGIGRNWIGDTLGGEHCQGERDKTAAVCFNNSDHTPNLDLIPVSDRLTEIDKSIRAVIRTSRANPVPVGRDKKTVKAFQDIVENIMDGELVSVLSENAMDDYAGRDPFQVIEFTKPQYMQLLQYLYESKESEYRNFYRKYGQNIQSTPKHAQILSAEIQGADSVTFIIPRDMLLQRQRFCEIASSIFQDEFSVRFADPWKSEEARYDAETEKQEAEAEGAAAEVEKTEAEAEKAEAEAEAAADPAESDSERFNRTIDEMIGSMKDGENNG